MQRTKVRNRHALRLSPGRMRTIRRLHHAGPDGLPEVLATDVCLLLKWEVAEIFTDESRVFTQRVRLSAFGERIATTLLTPLESK